MLPQSPPRAASPLLSRLPLSWVIAWRYLRGRRSQLLTSTARAALVATAMGVMAMVIAMALMTGYTQDLERKLIGLQGEVVASPLAQDAMRRGHERLARAAQIPGVTRVGRVAYGEGSLSGPTALEGVAVVLRGVDPQADPMVQDPALLSRDPDGVSGVILGTELQHRLQATTGTVLRLVLLQIGDGAPRFRYRSLRVHGTFTSGFAQFDNSWAILDRAVLEEARGNMGFDIAEFKLTDPALTDQVAAEVERVLGPEFLVSSWKRLNSELFAALRLQEMLLFLVLGLIVVVSTFNVASTLVILVRERRRDIGIWAALGLAQRHLFWTFTAYGLFLGAAGTLLGVVLGAGISWILTTYKLVSFGPEVAAIYFIDSVPFRVELTDLSAIVGFALGVTLLACALPALRAAQIRPALALRDE